MKNICFFGGNLNNAGGTERVSVSIANALSEEKDTYQVSMLNLWEGLSPFFTLNSNIKNHQIHSQQVSFIKSYFATVYKLRQYIIKHKIDTLIVVESMLSLFSLPAIIGLNVQHITWEHFNYNVDLGKKGRRLARYLSRMFSDKIIALTERDRMIWLEKTKGNAQIITIPNPSPYPISSHIPSLADKKVLAVGRLTYQKGFDLLLKAWAIVMKKAALQDWKLQIVGEGEDKAKLVSLIKELNLENSVELHPFSNQISSYYNNASFYCLSSRFEGLPMVLLEAQSFGLPIVSFNCDTGPSDIIDNEQNGYLCQPENIDDLADKLTKLMLSSFNTYINMVKSSKEISSRFSPNSIIEQWKNIV